MVLINADANELLTMDRQTAVVYVMMESKLNNHSVYIMACLQANAVAYLKTNSTIHGTFLLTYI